MNVKHACNLIIDSCCDLPMKLVDVDGVYVVRFPYTLSDGVHEDDMFSETDPHAFYEAIRKGKEAPSTAQITVPALLEAYNWALEEGKPCVYLSFSSGLSGSYDTACLVRNQFLEEHPDFELHVVDTGLASIAEGVLVYQALLQRENGLTAQEMVEWVEEARYYVNCSFMVDDLESLARGGRLPSAGAYLGSKLDVKPMVNFDLQGHLSMTGIARGRKKGMKMMMDVFERRPLDKRQGEVVLIAHSDAQKDADRLRESVLHDNPEAVLLVCNVGPVIGSHVGPGMLAVAFWGSDRRADLSIADRIARKVKGE